MALAASSARMVISVRNTFVHFHEACAEDLPQARHTPSRAKTVPASLLAQALLGAAHEEDTGQREEAAAQIYDPVEQAYMKNFCTEESQPATPRIACLETQVLAHVDPAPKLEPTERAALLASPDPMQAAQVSSAAPEFSMLPLWAHLPTAYSAQLERGNTLAPSSMDTAQSKKLQEDRTTVVLQNLPLNYRRPMLLRMLDVQGFAGKYDFVYVPLDFKTRTGLGYAFVNLVHASVVPYFWQVFDGYRKWIFPSAKVCRVTWSAPYQGLKAHVKRYRNSPLMHESVPDEYRPALFEDGVRVTFPAPTRKITAPSQKAAVKGCRGGRKPGA